MEHSFLPDLPSGYHWQLCADDEDITSDYYAESDATEARIWTETSDLVLHMTRTGDHGYWGMNGLRKWVIEGQPPEGLMSWEQFETLSDVGHRLHLEPLEV